MYYRGKFLVILAIIFLLDLHGNTVFSNEASWSSWSTWSDCDRSCGGGVMLRNRTCNSNMLASCSGDTSQTKRCNIHRCEGTLEINWFSVHIFMYWKNFCLARNNITLSWLPANLRLYIMHTVCIYDNLFTVAALEGATLSLAISYIARHPFFSRKPLTDPFVSSIT